MADAVLKNARELERKLQGFGWQIYRKWMGKAIVAGSRLIIAATRRKAPKRTGALGRSIGRKIKRYSRSLSVVGIIGPRTDFVATRRSGKLEFLRGRKASLVTKAEGRIRPSKYAHLVELGTMARRIKNWLGHKGRTKWVGKMPAKPFLQPAFAATHRAAMHAIVDKLREGIAKEARA